MSKEQSRLEQVLGALLGVFYVAYVMWRMVPEHTRRLVQMRALARIETASAALARAAGRAAMENELAGVHPGYELPATFSRVRDAARTLYHRLRSR